MLLLAIRFVLVIVPCAFLSLSHLFLLNAEKLGSYLIDISAYTIVGVKRSAQLTSRSDKVNGGLFA